MRTSSYCVGFKVEWLYLLLHNTRITDKLAQVQENPAFAVRSAVAIPRLGRGSETDISRPQGRRVILDRYNPSATDRWHWLSLALCATKPICVWFEYPTDLCIARAQRRPDHPTLVPGPRVQTAIASTVRGFQPPTPQEGYHGLVIVRSFEACVELVVLLSPPLTLFKFPRTAHLLNLGAATEDDIVQSTSSSAFSAASLTPESQILITEKIDGANLGISLDSSGRILIQNRAHWVNSKTHFQFKKLDIWVEQHRQALPRIIGVDSSSSSGMSCSENG